MKTIFYILLMLQVGYVENLVITTVAVGENVTLSCKRDASGTIGSLFWITLVPGNMPEILGRTFTFDYADLDRYSRITTKQEHGSFVLHVAQTRLSDTAFYFCLKTKRDDMSFLRGTFLRIKGPKPDFPAFTQDSLSDPVHQGDSVRLQCSVLSLSVKKTCPEERRVFWYRVSSAQSNPSLIYAQNEVEGKCENTSDSRSKQSCIFNFVNNNISFTDTGTYYCALAACGVVIFGNGTKLQLEDISIIDATRNNAPLLLLSVTLALMMIFTVLLICLIRRKYCKSPDFTDRKAEALYGQQQNQQRSEVAVIYSTPVFTQKSADRAGTVKTRRKDETIYSYARVFDKE